MMRIVAICTAAVLALSAAQIEPDLTKAQPIYKVGINNRTIAFAAKPSSKTFTGAFDFIHFEMDSRFEHMRFKTIKPDWNEYSLTQPYNYKDRSKLEIRQYGMRKLPPIDRKNLKAETHSVYGFIKDGVFLSGGKNGVLEAYNVEGDKIADLIGHKGMLRSLAYHNDWIVSSADDGLVMLWDYRDLVQKKHIITPVMKFLFAPNGEWLAWTDEGVYAASPKGDLLIATSASAASAFKRPELLELKIKRKKNAYWNEVKNIELSRIGSVPTVEFVEPANKTMTRETSVLAKACDFGGGISNIILYVNGNAVTIGSDARGLKRKKTSPVTPAAKQPQQCLLFEVPVTLKPGTNELVLVASSYLGAESQPAKHTIHVSSNGKEKPNLYIVAVGVDRYADKNIIKLNYSVNDVKTLKHSLASINHALHDQTYTYDLSDENVTEEKLTATFQKIAKTITRKDTLIVIFAGHGIINENTSLYEYIPYNYNQNPEYDDQRVNGISTRDIYTMLKPIKAQNILLLFDTCHSGSANTLAGDLSKSKNFLDSKGIVTLMASSKEQVALEGYRGHGIFTYVLLNALSGNADINKNRKISVSELILYVGDTLPDLSYRKFGYMQQPIHTSVGQDFDIGED